MTVTKLETTSYWIDSASLPRFARLDRDGHVDVVVVGGGITGITAAYLIAMAGRSVALLERQRLVTVDTAYTSAHLTMVTDQRLTDLVSHFGRDHAQAVWDAGLAAIAQIDAIVRAEEIECDFMWVPGYLHRPIGAKSSETARTFEEEAALASDLGFDASFVEQVPLVGVPGVRFEDQARFHPRKYLAGLAQAIVARGGNLYEHTEVEEFSDKPLAVSANGHKLTCGHIVLATHTPLMGITNVASAALFQTKLALYTSYVVAGRVAKGAVPDALLWDTADPYHYFRVEPHRDYDVVIFGGEDHKTGQAPDTNACYERLAAALTSIVPGIDLTHRWSGQVIETPDGLPYICETAAGQFAATGYSGAGLTFGTLGAMMACDRI